MFPKAYLTPLPMPSGSIFYHEKRYTPAMSTLDEVLTAEAQLTKPTAKKWWKIVVMGGGVKAYVCRLCRDQIATGTIKSVIAGCAQPEFTLTRDSTESKIKQLLQLHAQKHADEAYHETRQG